MPELNKKLQIKVGIRGTVDKLPEDQHVGALAQTKMVLKDSARELGLEVLIMDSRAEWVRK